MPTSPFNREDLRQLERHGIDEQEARRQLELFRRPPAWTDIVRPCTPNDGVLVLDEPEQDRLARAFEQGRRRRRLVKFVPASGAATRMFRDLLARDEKAVQRFMKEVHRFPFAEDLEAALRDGRPETAIDALLSDTGLGYADLPKGLLKFHRYPDGSRTPFEEHLREAVTVLAGEDGVARVHFTVSPEHLERFATLLDEVRPGIEAGSGVRLQVGFSTQSPSTDTLAVDLDDRPFRTEDGRLLLRPGGHGALIDNLAALEADAAFLRNIDNVQPEHARSVTQRWQAALGGLLLALQDGELAEVRSGFVEGRPLRVCAVVRNTGEPGGGPFWVRGADGTTSRQIVETAQIDPDSDEQQARLRASTHFNPVNMVCALRDPDGRRFDLREYIDEDAVIVARKSAGGRELKALERPGLWNGAMAYWNTVFVEVPLETFTPVKTVFDLLRPEHQPV